jgi:hypothetical protein
VRSRLVLWILLSVACAVGVAGVARVLLRSEGPRASLTFGYAAALADDEKSELGSRVVTRLRHLNVNGVSAHATDDSVVVRYPTDADRSMIVRVLARRGVVELLPVVASGSPRDMYGPYAGPADPVSDARADYDVSEERQIGGHYVGVRLTDEATDYARAVSRACHVGAPQCPSHQLAMVVDGEQVVGWQFGISLPQTPSPSPIDYDLEWVVGHVTNQKEALELAAVMGSGAFPTRLVLRSEP